MTVTPLDLVELPATNRDLDADARPAHGSDPRPSATLGRRCPAPPSSSCSSATSSASAAGIPCGGDTWLVDRLGADIGLRCTTCGRHVLVERPALERRLAAFVTRGDPALSAAVGAPARMTPSPSPTSSRPTPVEPEADDTTEPGALAVFRNRPFLLLWLSQAFTQIGGNMVIYGLTVIILETTRSNTAVSLLILTFLVPAVLFSAVAGVYVDRLDRRLVLIVTNVLAVRRVHRPLPRRRQPAGDPAPEHRHLDDHRVLRARPRRR